MVMAMNESEQVDIDSLIEDELLMLRHSGEIPEIALHHTLHFLHKDPEGPGLKEIPPESLKRLKEAVFKRYRVIVLRDMKPENRDLAIYRGLARSIINYKRLKRFCQIEGMDISGVRKEAGKFLKNFLEQEYQDVESGARTSCINCTWKDILDFAEELGVSPQTLPQDIEKMCPEKGEYEW